MSFDKTGYQLSLFALQPSTTDDAYQGHGGLCKENFIFIFKNMYEFKDIYRATPC